MFGTYHDAFYVAGSVAIFSSLLIFIVPCLIKREMSTYIISRQTRSCSSCAKCEQDRDFSLSSSTYSSSLESHAMLTAEDNQIRLCKKHRNAKIRLNEVTLVVDKETVL